MNMISYFNSLRDNQPKATTWEAVATEIRSNKLAVVTAEYRQYMAQLDEAVAGNDKTAQREARSKATARKLSLPAINGWTRLQGGRTKEHIIGYLPYMMVDIDHVPGDRLPDVVQAVTADPHVLLAYVTVSGNGYRAIVHTEGPVTEENFNDAWLTANEHICRLAGDLPFDPKCNDTTRLSALCHDAHAYFNPDALPLPIRPHLSVRRVRGCVAAPSKAGATARRLVEEEGISYVAQHRNSYVSRCIYWMNRFGVDPEKCAEWALQEFADYDADNGFPVRSIVNSIYHKHQSEFHTLNAGNFRCGTGREPRKQRCSIEEVEEYLRTHYRMRRNSLSHYLEFVPLDDGEPCGEWRELDDVNENTLWCELHRAGLRTDMQSLHTLLQSDFAPLYNPLQAYLDSLPPWDGTDYIGRFLSMVHCRHVSPAEFDRDVRRWLVGMVAAVLDERVVNHQLFVLLGPQGTFKSSFMNNILPPQLRAYYCTKTNSQRMTKDDAFSLTENILINMEEIDSMQRQEVNQLKAMATAPYVKERPAYGRSKVRLPHTASFCATGNNLQFLTDDSGNRRWLVFEVEHIDNPWTASIPYPGIYAQIRHLLQSGFRYWFEQEENRVINRRNRRFEAPNAASEILLSFYEKPAPLSEGRPETGVRYLTVSQIQLRFGNQLRIPTVALGRALADLGFEQVRTRNGRFWRVIERPISDVGRFLPPQDIENQEPEEEETSG